MKWNEYNVYVHHTSESNMILMFLYVDDILLTESCISEINKFKKVLMNAFSMTGLRNMIYFLGMEILHFEKGIIVHQLKYELELLMRFELMNCKSTVNPNETNHKLDSGDDGENVDAITFKQLVGFFRYLSKTRLNICYTVEMVSKFMSKAKWSYYQAVVRILRYVKESLRHEILFHLENQIMLI